VVNYLDVGGKSKTYNSSKRIQYCYAIDTIHKLKAFTQPISKTNTKGSNHISLQTNSNHKTKPTAITCPRQLDNGLMSSIKLTMATLLLLFQGTYPARKAVISAIGKIIPPPLKVRYVMIYYWACRLYYTYLRF
jgi:hypothetical protein